ncbi:MAG: hypothetical protein R2715_19235 [Ilumatobacteraceae bacterium]
MDGLLRIIRVATVFLTPVILEQLPERQLAAIVVELLVRLVISEFLAPSTLLDLSHEPTARPVIRTFVLPAVSAG